MERKLQSAHDEIRSIQIKRLLFAKIARVHKEYEMDFKLTPSMVNALRKEKVDVLTFVQRSWSKGQNQTLQPFGRKIEQNLLLLKLDSYDDWWKSIGKKSRNMIRKAIKSELQVMEIKQDEKLAQEMLNIYRSSRIKQQRKNLFWGLTLQAIKEELNSPNTVIVGAYFHAEL